MESPRHRVRRYLLTKSRRGTVERLGMFTRFVSPGLNWFCYPFEGIVGRVSLRVKQLDVTCETKTLDNVFVDATVVIQYQIQQDKVGPCHCAFAPSRQFVVLPGPGE